MNWSVAKLLLWCQETFNSFGSKPAAFCCFLSPPNQIKSEGRSGKGEWGRKKIWEHKKDGGWNPEQHTQTQKSPRSSENLCWTNSEVLAPAELPKFGEEAEGPWSSPRAPPEEPPGAGKPQSLKSLSWSMAKVHLPTMPKHFQQNPLPYSCEKEQPKKKKKALKISPKKIAALVKFGWKFLLFFHLVLGFFCPL